MVHSSNDYSPLDISSRSSRADQVKVVMKDPSLTMEEKQCKIREIMKNNNNNGKSGGISGSDVASFSSQEGNDKLLIQAAREGNLVHVQDLLAKGSANVNAKDKIWWGTKDWTPLHFSCDAGNLAMTKLLMENGADLHAKDAENGNTPLHLACEKCHLDVIELLLIEKTAHSDIVNVKNKLKRTPLHLACLEHRTFRDRSNLNLVKLLIDHGADLNAKEKRGFSPLRLAFEGRKPGVFKFLVENGADLNAKSKSGLTVLHVACERERLDDVKLLLWNGAQINPRDQDGETPLHRACRRGHLNLITLLLTENDFYDAADVNAQDDSGRTPLYLAYKYRRTEAFEFLIENGADVNVKSKSRLTVLHEACERARLDDVKLLIENCAQVNAKDMHGETPMHKACKNNAGLDVVQFLLSRGAIVHDIEVMWPLVRQYPTLVLEGQHASSLDQ